jgi:hypothetical protein
MHWFCRLKRSLRKSTNPYCDREIVTRPLSTRLTVKRDRWAGPNTGAEPELILNNNANNELGVL